MICLHPECTGVHDNNRWAELCPRSRAAKKLKDMRYIYSDKVIGGLLTQGFVVRRHREATGRYRHYVAKYGPNGKYAEMLGPDFEEVAFYERMLAQENQKFRAWRKGRRGTRRARGPSRIQERNDLLHLG